MKYNEAGVKRCKNVNIYSVMNIYLLTNNTIMELNDGITFIQSMSTIINYVVYFVLIFIALFID